MEFQQAGEQTGQGQERRAFPRTVVSTRSALWLDEGPSHGLAGTVFDISQKGFATRLLNPPPSPVGPGKTLYCVLMVRGAHLECLATVKSSMETEDGERQLGFAIDAISEDSERLLAKMLHYLDQHQDGVSDARLIRSS